MEIFRQIRDKRYGKSLTNVTNINKPGTYTLPIKVQRKKNFDYTLSSEVVTIQVEEVK